MPAAPRLQLVLAWVVAAATLAGCVTPQVRPKESQAVLDARARRDAPPAPACPPAPLSEVSPVMVGFGFDEAAIDAPMLDQLASAARWLACHTSVVAVIKPDADGHGTEAAQDQLARRRAEVVQQYLVAHAVPAAQIRVLDRKAPPPGGDSFFIRAEGRRW